MAASRAEERHASRRDSFTSIESFNGVASYTVGGDVFTSSIFKQLDRVTEVGFSRQGFRTQVVTGSVTGNRFRIQYYRNTGTDTVGRFTGEIASATDLTADSFWVIEEGI